ncbi:ATP-binding response regulator [Occallatibacter riparius]|uniref:ATP-binding protein n=1 Tax=Occallatibacter riparius TaxID=1002689 RepID=A0A9J7BU06_9BACT|nr:ATP-binding protein [Occallatibacter riparius]UWZ86073.1 ATP-binding protein [Occallatibacter riparius]
MKGCYVWAVISRQNESAVPESLRKRNDETFSAALGNSAAIQRAHRSVLVVADLEMNWMLFDYLVAQDWSVDYVAHNDLALAAAQKRHYDLIVTAEITSPRDDLELLRKIRAVRPHTRMIVLTGRRTTEDVIEALRERAFSLFAKPYSIETLKALIEMALDEKCWDDGIEVISATPSWIRLMVRCDLGTIERMSQFFQEMADLPEPERSQVATAFRELLLNAAGHGGGFNPDEYVEISYIRSKQAVACRVTDPGAGFSFTERSKTWLANPLEQLPERSSLSDSKEAIYSKSFGILLAKHLVDELIYNEQGNEVVLIKYLEDMALPPLGSVAH